MRVHEARARCPQLVLMHVEVIGAEGRGAAHSTGAPQQQGASSAGTAQQQGGNGGGASQLNTQAAGPRGGTGLASRQTHKACLERYRVASASIMGLLRKLSPGVRDPPIPISSCAKPPFYLLLFHHLARKLTRLCHRKHTVPSC